MSDTDYVVWLGDLGSGDVDRVGGKSASLGEMSALLDETGVGVPPGFAVTTVAFRHALDSSPGVRSELTRLLTEIDYDDFESLFRGAAKCRDLISDLEFPDDVEAAIASAYAELESRAEMRNVDVAVRSSAVSEDTASASFAGQYESFLGIRGRRDVVNACQDCFASFFTSRGVDYRHSCGLPPDTFEFAVTVQRMARSDRACSGVMFTLDPETGSRDFILLNASWGLGEPIVQGQVGPDEVLVFKPTLASDDDLDPIISHELGRKELKMVYAWGGTAATETIETTPAERAGFSVQRAEVLALARAGMLLEKAYGLPLDIEWAKDGLTGNLYLVQARPMTVHAETEVKRLERYRLTETSSVLATGQAVGNRIVAGPARVIHDIHGIDAFHEGEVLVTERTDPDWEPAMKRAAGIVTDTGGRTSHAAIVARELGVPCVVGAGDATDVIPDDGEITVSCVEEKGRVYAGRLAYERDVIDLESLPETSTEIMMIVGNPSQAIRHSLLPSSGVGLARLEFIVANQIGIHPRALLDPTVLDDAERARVEELTFGYASGPDYCVERLSDGIALIAAAFYPRDVIVRLTDFKSNEYRGLIGGSHFEPVEENPMLGWRGASRYSHPDYRDAFDLECRALRRVRIDMGLTNVKIMVPFVRTVTELETSVEVLAAGGLCRGEDGLEIYMMVEVPANVILLHEFAQHVDGLSIGSNDLTQLTLGLDRDAGALSELGDERDPAVQEMLRMALRTVGELRDGGHSIKVGICGQAPSDFPEITRLVVDERIDSVSVVPDAVVPTILTVAEAERRRAID